VDKHVVGESIQESEGLIAINEITQENPEEWTKEKTRNETDIIRTRVKKTIEQKLGDDPYAQKVFSELLREAISQAEQMFNHPYKQYTLLKEFEEQVNSRSVAGIPEELGKSETAKAYYGTFRLVLGDDHFEAIAPEEKSQLVEEAKTIDAIVSNAVAEHSLNPQSMEASIKTGILPRLFKLMGLEKAKDVIEHIIQITRVRLAHGNE
jgi:type I restriction enzyme R subunit